MSLSWHITQPHRAFIRSRRASTYICPHQDVEQHHPWMGQAHCIKQGWNFIFRVQYSFLFLSQSLPLPPTPPLPLPVQVHYNFNLLGENAAQRGFTPTSALHPVGPCPVLPGTQPCFQVLESFHWAEQDFCDLSAYNSQNPRRGLVYSSFPSSIPKPKQQEAALHG